MIFLSIATLTCRFCVLSYFHSLIVKVKVNTVGQNGDFADIRGHLKGTKCYRGSWQLVLTYERNKSNGSQSSFKTFIFRGVNTIIRA